MSMIKHINDRQYITYNSYLSLHKKCFVSWMYGTALVKNCCWRLLPFSTKRSILMFVSSLGRFTWPYVQCQRAITDFTTPLPRSHQLPIPFLSVISRIGFFFFIFWPMRRQLTLVGSVFAGGWLNLILEILLQTGNSNNICSCFLISFLG